MRFLHILQVKTDSVHTFDYSKEDMKKILLTAFTLSLISLQASAQNNVSVSDLLTFNIRLHPIQTIEVTPLQKVVNLDYVTKADYENGVNVDQPDHLRVYSTGGFAVRVESSSPLKKTGSTEEIDVSDIIITPSSGSTESADTHYPEVNLTPAAQELISSTTGGVDRKFNINYRAAGVNKYVNRYVNLENPTVYTGTIMYSIMPK